PTLVYMLQFYYVLPFFFYCYAHHRDLHSFPTRRSSDLRVVLRVLGHAELRGQVDQLADEGEDVLGRQHAHVLGHVDAEPLVELVDRKSTRLNSSHLGISYAVFCLKKKKKK